MYRAELASKLVALDGAPDATSAIMALACQPALAAAPAWLTSSPITPGPCVQEFIQMICKTGGNVPCEALRGEAVREPAQPDARCGATS